MAEFRVTIEAVWQTDGTFEEFRIPKSVQDTILEMDMSKYLTKK